MHSANFYIEVCKLLLLGATFHASTTTPLIAQAISYVCQHSKQLTTMRQLMSVCIPIMNLQDGQSAGRQIVLSHFIQPLINAVIQSIPCQSSDNTIKIVTKTINSNSTSNTLVDSDSTVVTDQKNKIFHNNCSEVDSGNTVKSQMDVF